MTGTVGIARSRTHRRDPNAVIATIRAAARLRRNPRRTPGRSQRVGTAARAGVAPGTAPPAQKCGLCSARTAKKSERKTTIRISSFFPKRVHSQRPLRSP